MNLTEIAKATYQFLLPPGKALPADGKPKTAVALYQHEAIDELLKYLTRTPDLDEVLRSRGIRREHLSVLLYDDEISQAAETRQDALTATPLRLEPSEGAPADALRLILEPHRNGYMAAVFRARLFGYTVMEAVYSQPNPAEDRNWVGLQFLGEKPLRWFDPRPDGTLRYYPTDGTMTPKGEGIAVDQEFKFFLTRNKPTYENPLGEAILSRLYWPWFFRTNGWKFWGKFLERFGSPLLIGKSTNPQDMVSALLMAHSQSVMGVGPDDDVKAEGVPAGNSGQSFEMYENACIRRIQKVILGQTLTSGTDGGSGNRALGQVHDSVRTDKRNSDTQLASQTMQRVVDALCKLNGWPRHIVSFADDVGLESDRAERDKKLYDMGIRFKKTYVSDAYDLNDEDYDISEAPDPLELIAAKAGLPPSPKPGVDPGKKGAPPGTKQPSPVKAGLFSRLPFARAKLTAQQEELEGIEPLVDSAGAPISEEAIRNAIFAATDPNDLEARLFTLLGDNISQDTFREVLEASLFAADVLGYVHAEGKV